MTLILSRYLAVTSMMGATIELASDLKISGDAQVKGISVKGDTSKWNDTTKSEEKLYKDKQVFDSEINLNLDFKTTGDIANHKMILGEISQMIHLLGMKVM